MFFKNFHFRPDRPESGWHREALLENASPRNKNARILRYAQACQ